MSGYRRALWAIDTVGRVLTVVTLLGFAGAMGTVVVVLIHALSHLTAGWLIALGAAAFVIAAIASVIPAARALSERLHIVGEPHACFATKDPHLGLVLTGTAIVTYSGPQRPGAPNAHSLAARRVWTDKHPLIRRRAITARLTRLGKTPVSPTGARYGIQILVPRVSATPQRVNVRVVLRDQYNAKHRGRVVFLGPQLPPITPEGTAAHQQAAKPANNQPPPHAVADPEKALVATEVPEPDIA